MLFMLAPERPRGGDEGSDPSKAGGSFRSVVVVVVGVGWEKGVLLVRLVGLLEVLGVRVSESQSGWCVGENGFDGRSGLIVRPGPGAWILERACMPVEMHWLVLWSSRRSERNSSLPLSSHHLLRSELAGGSPGSIDSYPSKSSSSGLSSLVFAVESPTTARRCS